MKYKKYVNRFCRCYQLPYNRPIDVGLLVYDEYYQDYFILFNKKENPLAVRGGCPMDMRGYDSGWCLCTRTGLAMRDFKCLTRITLGEL